MKGLIGPGVVPVVLRSIHLEGRTGMLRFIRNDERRSLRFMSGHIVYGEASVKELRLGEVLVAAGRLDPTVLERALAAAQRERKRLGAVLVDMGILDENGLEEALALHVRAILRSAGFEDMLREGRERIGEGKTWEAVTLFEEVTRRARGRLRTRAEMDALAADPAPPSRPRRPPGRA